MLLSRVVNRCTVWWFLAAQYRSYLLHRVLALPRVLCTQVFSYNAFACCSRGAVLVQVQSSSGTEERCGGELCAADCFTPVGRPA